METAEDRAAFFELGDEIKHNGTPVGRGFLDSQPADLAKLDGFSFVLTTNVALKTDSLFTCAGTRYRVKTIIDDNNGVYKYGIIKHSQQP